MQENDNREGFRLKRTPPGQPHPFKNTLGAYMRVRTYPHTHADVHTHIHTHHTNIHMDGKGLPVVTENHNWAVTQSPGVH